VRAIFVGPDAYASPSWYETKRQTAEVVPTRNYLAGHTYGTVEVFHGADTAKPPPALQRTSTGLAARRDRESTRWHRGDVT